MSSWLLFAPLASVAVIYGQQIYDPFLWFGLYSQKKLASSFCQLSFSLILIGFRHLVPPLPPPSSLIWLPFFKPFCGVTLYWLSLILVSNSFPSPKWSESPHFNSLLESQLEEQRRAACHWYPILLQPRRKPRKGKSGHVFNWLCIFPLPIPFVYQPLDQKGSQRSSYFPNSITYMSLWS